MQRFLDGKVLEEREAFDRAVEDGTKYSLKGTTGFDVLKHTWSEQIDAYKKGLLPTQTSLLMGGTPKALLDIGLSNLPMTMDQTHVNYALNGKNGDLNHKLGEAMLKQLPELMKNPVAVFASKTHPDNSVMMILQGIVNGAQETAVLRISEETMINKNRFDVNHLVTVQGRGNASNLLSDALKEEQKGNIALFCWDKNKATLLLNGKGLQLPNISAADGFVHSIQEN